MKKRYRIKSRLRFFMSFMIILFLVLSIAANVAGSDKNGMKTKDDYVVVKVNPGDTIWNMAKLYGPEGKDIRRVVHKICLINQIGPEELRPGQELKIPLI